MYQHYTFDETAAVPYLEGQRRHIETSVNRAPLAEIQYPTLIPVDSSAHPWADTVEFSSIQGYGEADWINGNADDIPMAGTSRAKFRSQVHMAGIGYGYGYGELAKAALEGTSLPEEDAFAARRASQEFVEKIAITGDTRKGLFGLVNNPNVAVQAALNGDWNTATEAEILADINEALAAPMTATNYIGWSNTLLMSPERVQILGTRKLSDSTMTLLQWVLQHNAYTVTTGQSLLIRGVRGLSTAGASNTQRMVAYRRDPEVLKLHYPMPHRFLPAREMGVLRYVVPGVMRLGGLDIRRPLEMAYRDGI